MRLPQIHENSLPPFNVEFHGCKGLSHLVNIKNLVLELEGRWPGHVEVFVEPLPGGEGVVELKW